MYTTQKNLQIVVSLLKQYGIRHIVISPGSRNMGLVRSIEGDPFFKTYSVVDERSAAYIANGIFLETGEPVALSSTSAQATRNYIPGMTEAFYRHSKLVFITSDYRPSFVGQGVMQALDQMSIPKDSARYSVNLPVINDANDQRYCVRLVNEALLELDHNGTGPVHINVPTEEHWGGGVDTLPKASKIDRHVTTDTYPSLEGKKIMVYIGQHSKFSPELEAMINEFSVKYDAIICTTLISNFFGERAIHASLQLEGMDKDTFKKYAPELVITIGGQPGDYTFDSKIKSGVIKEHWRVATDGIIQDTYGKLTNVFEASEDTFFGYYNTAKARNEADIQYKQWRALTSKPIIPSNLPFSHTYVASRLNTQVPADAIMHFAILNSLRNWNYVIDTPRHLSYANVAGYGIDGCMSTFIGQSLVTDKLSVLVIGDLSFFYDMNSLGIRGIKNNARIIMINNAGGAEFRLSTNAASEFGEDANKHIAAGGHFGSAKAWAESMNWEYRTANDEVSLEHNAQGFFDTSEKPIIFEIFTTMANESDGLKLLVSANASKSMKSKIIATLSPQAKRQLKKLLKK